MKKLVLLVAVIASVSMFSCTGTQEGSASTDTTAVDTAAVEQVDTTAADSTKAEAAPVEEAKADAAAPAVDPAAEKADSVAK